MDLSYFDSPLPVDSPEQKSSELEMLKELAGSVGQYNYEYKEEAIDDSNLNAKPGEFLGIMAQDLLKIPGLASSVDKTFDKDGNETLQVDGNRLALAALGYVAALSRVVLEMKGIEYGNTDKTVSNTVSGETTGAETGTGTSGSEGGAGEVASLNNEGQAMETGGSFDLKPASTADGLGSPSYYGLDSEVYNI